MYPYRPNRFPTHIPMQRTFGSPFMPMQRLPMHHQFPQTRGFGGLLSKLLNKGNVPTSFQGFNGMGAPLGNAMFGANSPPNVGGAFFNGGASGLSNMMNNFSSGGITGMLNNVQKVMGLAQQFGPMIQQYGPLVKNMPAMLKIMKELNNAESTDDDSTETSLPTNEELEFSVEKELPDFDKLKIDSNKTSAKLSKPKLYI